MRLDKYLAHAGAGTRKEVKLWIRKGFVCVNEEVCKKDDTHIQEGIDHIFLDGEEIFYQKYYYIMLHKPEGVVSAVQDATHDTVLDLIDLSVPGLFPVGRLDMDTKGMLLITNDGQFSHQLMSPKKHVAKVYEAEIEHALSKKDITLLESGEIVLDEEPLEAAKVEIITDTIIHLTLTQGKYHQVKRMLSAVGNEVIHLKRIQIGHLHLDETLQEGEWRMLADEELAMLLA